jgi:hypothetical protein
MNQVDHGWWHYRSNAVRFWLFMRVFHLGYRLRCPQHPAWLRLTNWVCPRFYEDEI